MGSLREAGEEGVEGGMPKEAGAGKNREKIVGNSAQYFTPAEAHRGGNRYREGREPGVQGTGRGNFTTPPPNSRAAVAFPKMLASLFSYLKQRCFPRITKLRAKETDIHRNGLLCAPVLTLNKSSELQHFPYDRKLSQS